MRLDPRRALVRTIVASIAGFAVATLLVSRHLSLVLAAFAGLDAGGVTLALLIWSLLHTCDAAETRRRAAAEDPGRNAVFTLVLASSGVSLLAATALVRDARHVAPDERALLVVLCLATVGLAWTLTHAAFALRYAHLYYREDAEGIGGVEFPGGAAPRYFDFAYLAFTVGMTFQVSDTAVSSPQIRRAVLLQGVIAFAYNTAILAFVLNLAFGLAS